MIFNPNTMPRSSGGSGAITGTYTGNAKSNTSGTTTQTIKTGCVIDTLLIYQVGDDGNPGAGFVRSSITLVHRGVPNPCVTLSDTDGFTVINTSTRYGSSYEHVGFNMPEGTYNYVAFPQT